MTRLATKPSQPQPPVPGGGPHIPGQPAPTSPSPWEPTLGCPVTIVATRCAACGQATSRGECACTAEWDLCPWCGATRPACPDWDGHDRLHRGSELTWWRMRSQPSALRLPLTGEVAR